MRSPLLWIILCGRGVIPDKPFLSLQSSHSAASQPKSCLATKIEDLIIPKPIYLKTKQTERKVS